MQNPNNESYWSSEPCPAWSGRIEFPGKGVPRQQFIDTAVAIAEAHGHRYTGFVTLDAVSGNVTSFTRTIAPRRKYPVASPAQCVEGMAWLSGAFSSPVVSEQHLSNSFRAVIGLHVGQQDTYQQPPEHSPASVRAMLQLHNLQSTVSAAEVFTVRFSVDGTTTYSEPVAIITGPFNEVPEICALGVELGQERFTIEQFKDGQPPTVQMIETTHCQEPEFTRLPIDRNLP